MKLTDLYKCPHKTNFNTPLKTIPSMPRRIELPFITTQKKVKKNMQMHNGVNQL